jgi:hypothetical protein
MKKFFIACFLYLVSLSAFSTGQAGDIIIWNNDTLALFSNPLESYPTFDIIRGKLFGIKTIHQNTGCVRGYIAEWQIIDNLLYLTNIYDCLDRNTKADLKFLFPDKIKNGKIQAEWVNEILIVPKGKCLYYGNLGYVAIYEKEYELTIQSGKLIAEKEYDNSRTRKSFFTMNPDSLLKFIYSNIHWSKFPEITENPVKVNLVIVSAETAKPDIRILRGSGNILYDEEALRVASLIPDWDVYYQRGKVYRVYFSLAIIFDKEKKIKYTH